MKPERQALPYQVYPVGSRLFIVDADFQIREVEVDDFQIHGKAGRLDYIMRPLEGDKPLLWDRVGEGDVFETLDEAEAGLESRKLNYHVAEEAEARDRPGLDRKPEPAG